MMVFQQKYTLMLVVCVLWSCLTFSAHASLKQADAFFDKGMQLFMKNRYMQAMPLFGRTLGQLSAKQHARRAKSLFYIGLCYYRVKKYRKHAAPAWKRFLKEVTHIPNATQLPEWRSRIQLVRAVLNKKTVRPKRPKHRPITMRQAPEPFRRRNHVRIRVQPKSHWVNPEAPEFSKSTNWLQQLRRCLRVPEHGTRAKLKRLKMCRKQMPQGQACTARCQAAKENVTQRIDALQTIRKNELGEPLPPSSVNKRPIVRQPQHIPAKKPVPWNTIRTSALVVGGVFIAGGALLWLYGDRLQQERDVLLRRIPSPSVTSELVGKQDAAVVVQTLAIVGLSVGGVVAAAGLLLPGYTRARFVRRRYHSVRRSFTKNTTRVQLFSSLGE